MSRKRAALAFVLASIAAGAGARAAAATFEPPRLLKGEPPDVPLRAAGGGLVLLDVAVEADGSVGRVGTVVSVAPYTQELRRAASRFRFRAAREDGEERAARVLVAGYFRPPALMVPGPVVAPGEMPEPQVAMPTAVTPPLYPANARGAATVILDVRIDPEGRVTSASVIESTAGFDHAAVDAAREWRFQVPDLAGPRPASAVLVFVFREPGDIGPPPQK